MKSNERSVTKTLKLSVEGNLEQQGTFTNHLSGQYFTYPDEEAPKS